MDTNTDNKKPLFCLFANTACLLLGVALGVGGYHLANEQNLFENINLPVTPITSITKSVSEGSAGASATSEMLDIIINNGEPPTCESIRSHVMLKAHERGLSLGPKEFDIIETQCSQLESLDQVMDTADQPEQSAAPADVSHDKIKAQMDLENELVDTESSKDDLEY